MAQDIHTTLHVTVKEGKIEEFNRLVEEICKAVEDNEPGAKRYQFFLNDDETSVRSERIICKYRSCNCSS